jgi:hypothetical protein
VPATPDEADLIDAPLDDEPFAEEEQAAADAALERVRQGHYVLLDDLIADSITSASLESSLMPIELDKGHDQPIFGPEGKPNMAERFRLAGEIVRDFGGRAKGIAAALRVRMMTSRPARRGRRGRPA